MDRTPADDHGGDAVDEGDSAPEGHARDSTGRPPTRVAVTVTRTGGIAGLRRTWRAEAVDDDVHYWVELIEQCPWDAVTDGTSPDGTGSGRTGIRGADRFLWLLDARCGEDAHDAELAESDVDGPWRELIDAVREAGAPVPPVSGRRGPSSSSPA